MTTTRPELVPTRNKLGVSIVEKLDTSDRNVSSGKKRQEEIGTTGRETR